MRVARASWFSAAAFAIAAAALAGCGATAAVAKAPSRPTPSLSALGAPVLKVRSAPTNGAINEGLQSQVAYTFAADPSLSTATGSATAYTLVSPTDGAAATGTIATALGLSDTVTYLGPGNYNGGPSPGPNVTVDTVSGILNWQYPTWSGSRTQPIPASPSITVNPNAPLLADGKATTDAEQLLEAAGVSEEQLGAPAVSRYEAGVNVTFSKVAGGLATDQSMQVEYGPGGTVLTASGVIVTAAPSATYPTISPTDAVGLLTNGSGSVSGGTNQSIVTVDITRATMSLSTYSLADGASWLLPTWTLSGSESGSFGAPSSTYTGSVLAIPAKYVKLARAT
jgi:hypothetical protein